MTAATFVMTISTVKGPDQVENDSRQDVESLIAALRGSGVEFDAVYLLGCFGGGEGGVSIDSSRWRGANDYELIVVCPESVAAAPSLKPLGRELAESLGAEVVDIGCLRRASLSKLSPTLKHYELKHASLLLAGQDLRPEIPDFKAEDIPPYEFARLLCKRAAGLLAAGLPEHSASSRYRNSRYARACVSVGDIAVYLGNGYHPLCRERLHFFQWLAECERVPFPLSQAECEWIVRAYLRKLDGPSSLPFAVDEALMQGMIGRAYCATAARCAGKPIRTVRGAERVLLSHHRRAPQNVDGTVRGRGKRRKSHGADATQRILLSLPVFYCTLLARHWLCRAGYLRRFWFLPGALKAPWNASSAVRLWEEYCHVRREPSG